MKIHLLIISLIITVASFSQVLSLHVPENDFGLDESKLLIVSHLENIDSFANTSAYNQITISLGQKNYNFNSVPNSLDYSNAYTIQDVITSNQYTLYLTPLPIVMIETNNSILDEPKVLANFVYSDEEQTVISNIGIELRGGVSQSYPKKTYDIEFWDDPLGDIKHDEQFGDLRNDDDWILDGLYNEPLRLQSYVASKLWKEIHTPYYINNEAKAKSGADVMYVELFLNMQYNGVYNLSEQVDKKQLKLKSYNTEIRGELYKGTSWGATTFTDLPSYNNGNREWSGYAFKYPKEEDITDWGNLYQFTDFVINSSDVNFSNNAWTKFNEGNFIDYFLFLNLIRATDNTGKNIYLAKYQANEPYFYVPWDLDGCFGTIWDGTSENITNDILSNAFIDRVIEIDPNNISNKMANKWFEYRNNIFSNDSLTSYITTQYNFLQDNKIYEREAVVYSNYSFNNQDLLYSLDWLESRLEFLDIYFGNILSVNSLTPLKMVSLYPNPVKDQLYLSSASVLIGKGYEVYNTLGKLVSTGVIHKDYILLENLNKGFYSLQIEGNSYKFIKD